MFFHLSHRHIFRTLLIQTRHKATKSKYTNTALQRLLTDMPKDRPHLADAQKQRLKIKEKSFKYVPGTVTLQVLGSGAPGTPASVYLFTDQSRYMFNCGEGTQRLAHEHKTKLSRLEHIFLTRTSWSRLGGLPGLSLTVQDAGVPNLTLHGPPGLDELYAGMSRFVILKDLSVNAVDCTNKEIYNDQVLTVTPVPILRKNTELYEKMSEAPNVQEVAKDETDYFSHEGGEKNQNTVGAKSEESGLSKRDKSVAISYICKLKPKPGSLNLEKCVDKGVMPGPILGQLKNGLDVILPNGTVVRADDVRGPTDPGPVFIFMDIPSEEYLESFEENSSTFAKYQSSADNDADLALVVVHFSPKEIVEHPQYQRFMDRFSPSTKHLVLNSTNIFSGYLAAHRIQHQLNQLSNSIFPLLKETTQEADMINNCKRLKFEEDKSQNQDNEKTSIMITDNARSMTYFHLRPRKGLDRSSESILNPTDYIEETHKIEGFQTSLEEVKNKIQMDVTHGAHEYPKVVFLGTGSCIPNKTRNVSSILLNVNRNSNVLLDCGEGTWGQMVRFYGNEKASVVLRNLKAIYISHLHADHHIGLLGLLKERKSQFGADIPKLLLFAPKQIRYWLSFYNHRIEPIEDTYNLIHNGDLIETPFSTDDTNAMGIQSISTCLVKHCAHSFGVALVLSRPDGSVDEPIKITYSGDTMPCNDLVELGMNSSILIHEATMEDELVAEAQIKMHSTVSQAIAQGNKMNAKHIILTHFSQRYAKLPRIETSMTNNIGIAFDNMQITLDDIKHLNLMYPTMKLMFTDHCEELEHKAMKRALKNERKRLSSASLNFS